MPEQFATADNGGTGQYLDPAYVRIAGLFAWTATGLSVMAIWSHLKNYRKPVSGEGVEGARGETLIERHVYGKIYEEKKRLQRFVVRIIAMVPIYAISSWISLISLRMAFYLDAVRDIYEAFVMYCFFNLLINYLGGDRSLLISRHGHPPLVATGFIRFFVKEIDISDPLFFLFLKRSILQYVYIKPLLAAATMILKWNETYNDGTISTKSGMIWHLTGLGLAILSWLGIISDNKDSGDDAGQLSAENRSVAIQDFLICMEMTLAAIGHWYAYSYKDYIDPTIQSARMPIAYAFRDAMGTKDVFEDTLEIIHGGGFDYRTFEPAEGRPHTGKSLANRLNAGMRVYGETKYWLGKRSNSALSDDCQSLHFPDSLDEDDENIYKISRQLGEQGDYNCPVINGTEVVERTRPKPKPRRKLTISKKQKGKRNVFYRESDEDEEYTNNLLARNGEKKERQLSETNVPPFRTGCVDLIVKDETGKRFESYADMIPSASTSNGRPSFAAISVLDPFVLRVPGMSDI
ncbi:8836_t:CDS:2, partial [Paraglomus occultum]